MLKRDLGVIIGRELTFSSPLVTISGVDITPDLKQAHVFIGALGKQSDRVNAIKVLEQNRGFLQSELAKRVALKFTPHLHFKLDEGIERGTRVLSVMDELGLLNPEPTEGESEKKPE